MNKQYAIKDIKKALDYLESKFKTLKVNLEIDDMGRISFSTTDVDANSVKITVYQNDSAGTKFPEIQETRRL